MADATGSKAPPSAPWRLVLLAVGLAGLAVVVHHPHWNPSTGETNPYPVHLDEYVHWGYAKKMLDEGAVVVGNPFEEGHAPAFEVEAHLHERGFHAYLAAVHAVTGIGWVPLFTYGPVALALLLGLAVFALAERWGAGVEAVLFLVAIPTSLRFLGPGFMVPIAFSLPFLALGFFVLAHGRGARSLAVLLLLGLALWTFHAMAGVTLVAASALASAALLARHPARGLALGGVSLVPLLLAWPYVSRFVRQGLFEPWLPSSLEVIQMYGLVPLALAGVGAALLVMGPPEERRAGWTLGALVALAETAVLVRLATGKDPLLVYDRVMMVLFLVGSVLAGVAVARAGRILSTFAARRLGPRAGLSALAAAMLLLVPAAVAASSAQAQFAQDYYVVLTPAQHEAYLDAAPLVAGQPGRALVEGISTMPFTLLTGKTTLHVVRPGSELNPPFVHDFFVSQANDTLLLVRTGTTIVVTENPVSNPDLVRLSETVYVLRPDIVARMHI